MSTANELLAAACASGISCLDEMNLLRVIAQGANAGGGGGGGGGGGTLSTDGTFAANSDLLYPSQKAAKTYVDAAKAAAIASSNATSDSLYVKKAGDTMTGLLTLNASANVISGQSYRYNGVVVVRGITALNDYFFGPAGNFTMTGVDNSAIGFDALLLNTTGASNVAIGARSLRANTTGSDNTAIGTNALFLNTTGASNIAIGLSALLVNTTGIANTAIGPNTLVNNTVGNNNSAIGSGALTSNTTGIGNVAVGTGALFFNTTANGNIAIGNMALQQNTTGAGNVAIGASAINANTTGSSNTGIGSASLFLNVVGNNNTSIGFQSILLGTGNNNTAIGFQSGDNLTTGSNNLIIGYDVDAPIATGSNQLVLGNILFGTGLTGTGTTIAGSIGIGTNAPNEILSILGARAALYNTLTSSTNFERLDIEWAANVCRLWTEKGSGGGTARDFVLGADATEVIRITSADLKFALAKTISIASGANQRAGNAVLVGGTVTVSNTTVTAVSLILLTRKAAAGTLGQGLVYSVIANTSFTITSVDATGVLSALDTSTISYTIFEVP